MLLQLPTQHSETYLRELLRSKIDIALKIGIVPANYRSYVVGYAEIYDVAGSFLQTVIYAIVPFKRYFLKKSRRVAVLFHQN